VDTVYNDSPSLTINNVYAVFLLSEKHRAYSLTERRLRRVRFIGLQGIW